ncbi:hypothetical protein D3C75_810690 [compost metagenome]
MRVAGDLRRAVRNISRYSKRVRTRRQPLVKGSCALLIRCYGYAANGHLYACCWRNHRIRGIRLIVPYPLLLGNRYRERFAWFRLGCGQRYGVDNLGSSPAVIDQHMIGRLEDERSHSHRRINPLSAAGNHKAPIPVIRSTLNSIDARNIAAKRGLRNIQRNIAGCRQLLQSVQCISRFQRAFGDGALRTFNRYCGLYTERSYLKRLCIFCNLRRLSCNVSCNGKGIVSCSKALCKLGFAVLICCCRLVTNRHLNTGSA